MDINNMTNIQKYQVSNGFTLVRQALLILKKTGILTPLLDHVKRDGHPKEMAVEDFGACLEYMCAYTVHAGMLCLDDGLRLEEGEGSGEVPLSTLHQFGFTADDIIKDLEKEADDA